LRFSGDFISASNDFKASGAFFICAKWAVLQNQELMNAPETS